MIEKMFLGNVAGQVEITVRTGDDIVGAMKGEHYCGYEITVEYGKEKATIQGCHDLGPEFMPLEVRDEKAKRT